MGVPKRRISKTRGRRRRAVWRKIDAPTLVECPRCRELKMPHRACASCGYYKDQEILNVK